MREWPGLIFEKIPTLYTESNAVLQGVSLKELERGRKLEDLLDMAVIAIGDGPAGDRYPIQVVDFSKGAELVKGVNSIYPEGGGHGNAKESYDLAAYFLLNHCKIPNMKGKPLLVVAGDEGFYDKVDALCVKQNIGDDLPQELDSNVVMKKLAERFDTYILRPEPSSYGLDVYRQIHNQWVDVFGAQRVLRMDNPKRLVDCFIGICGYASDNFKISEELLKRRQTPEQVDDVLRTLHPLLSKSGGKD